MDRAPWARVTGANVRREHVRWRRAARDRGHDRVARVIIGVRWKHPDAGVHDGERRADSVPGLGALEAGVVERGAAWTTIDRQCNLLARREFSAAVFGT